MMLVEEITYKIYTTDGGKISDDNATKVVESLGPMKMGLQKRNIRGILCK